MAESPEREKILVFEPRMLGDAVLSIPFITAARRKFEVHVACRPAASEIYRWAKADRIIPLLPPWEREGRTFKNLALWKQLRRESQKSPYAVCTSVWADSRVHLAMNFIASEKRLGFPMNHRNYYAPERPWRARSLRVGKILNAAGTLFFGRPLLDHAIQKKDVLQHHAHYWMQLAEALKLEWDENTPWFSVPPRPPSSGDFDVLDQWRQEHGTLWVVHPGARSPLRRWPAEKFTEVLREFFSKRGIPVAVISAPGEPLPQISGALQKVVAPGNLSELASYLATATHVLCNDTMVEHLAAALGKRTVAIFGPQRPEWFAPLGSLDLVVANDVCKYRPCFDHCVMPSPICIESVMVSQVTEKLRAAEGPPA